jgi:hypothetical protein
MSIYDESPSFAVADSARRNSEETSVTRTICIPNNNRRNTVISSWLIPTLTSLQKHSVCLIHFKRLEIKSTSNPALTKLLNT